MNTDCETGNNYIYNLYGSINHRGGDLDFGHYFSNIKREGEGFWWQFNDAYVDNLDSDLIQNSSVYILFYIRQ